MPINSALNPLLYSRIMRSLWSRGWSSFRSRLSSKSSSNVSFEASSCEVNKHAAAKKVSSASFYGSAIVEEDKTSDASVSSDVGTDEVIDCSVVTTTIPATRHLATPKDAPIDEESDIDYGIDSYYEEDSDDVTDNPPCNDIHQTELPTFH
uniref:Uncharacterized protein n=1 Tax=Ciona savignyi TaxID=51511 RepID=H2YSL8_CIOSA